MSHHFSIVGTGSSPMECKLTERNLVNSCYLCGWRIINERNFQEICLSNLNTDLNALRDIQVCVLSLNNQSVEDFLKLP
jgi:hypothetical protein